MDSGNITNLSPEIVKKIQSLYALSENFVFIKPSVYLSKSIYI